MVDPGCGIGACIFVVILRPGRVAQLRRLFAYLRGRAARARAIREGEGE